MRPVAPRCYSHPSKTTHSFVFWISHFLDCSSQREREGHQKESKLWTGEKLSLGDRGGRAAVAPPRPPTVKKDASRACVCNGDVISRVGYGSIDAVPHMGFVCVLYRLFS